MSFLDTLRRSPPQRQLVWIAVAAALICGCLVAGYFIFLDRPFATLYSNLRPTDAAAIVAELDKKKIPYRLEDGGARILVPQSLADSARLDLADDEPPVRGLEGFELFNKSDMGLTEFAQRINYQRALQGELARTIMTMDAVDSARVHLTIAEPTLFRDDRRPSKASVTVVTRPGKQLTDQTVQGIQRLVAGAVPDLDPSNVTVLDAAGDVVSGAAANLAPESPRSQEASAISQYYEAKLRNALSGLIPIEASISVEVRADPDQSSIDGAAAALDSWSAGQRGFPITVSINLPAPPSPSADSEIRRIASTAVGLDAGRGDALLVASGGATASAEGPPAPATHPSTPSADAMPGLRGLTPRRDVTWLIYGLLGVMLLLGGGLIFTGRRSGPRSLSLQQRDDLARRLRALLDEGEEHANSPF